VAKLIIERGPIDHFRNRLWFGRFARRISRFSGAAEALSAGDPGGLDRPSCASARVAALDALFRDVITRDTFDPAHPPFIAAFQSTRGNL
jgi:hypothetical protein